MSPGYPVPPSGCLLIVDDDPLVGRTFLRALRRLEIPVELVATVAAARARVERGGVAGLLVDLSLNGETGLDVYDFLAQSEPALARRLLFVSGGVCDPMIARRLEGLDNPVLAKPITPSALRAAVSGALAGVA